MGISTIGALVLVVALLGQSVGMSHNLMGSVQTSSTGYTIYLPVIADEPQLPVPIQLADPVLLAAGDIADCNLPGDVQTAAIAQSMPSATVLTLGDNAYQDGTSLQFTDCYGPTWGQFIGRTHPAPGNHEYLTANAAGYFGYFGAAAGSPAQGYYSFDLGNWHIMALNSECQYIGGCQAGSPEANWLSADLAATTRQCKLAYWHRPLFSSGLEGSDPNVQYLWQVLYDNRASIILSGHDHIYERFAPQDALGNSDPAAGITEFVVGTGGYQLSSITSVLPNSVVRQNSTFGVLELVLHSQGYDWQYLPVTPGAFSDAGSAVCH